MARLTIDVAITAWPNHPKRLAYFSQTMAAFRELVTASEHRLRLCCSAETERDPRCEWYGDDLEELCREYHVELQWRDGPANLGANMNAAMRMGDGDLILLQQDDWCPRKRLDLSLGAHTLITPLGQRTDVDIVRYSWPEAPNMLPTFGDLWDGWRRLDPAGKWPYGDDPHIRRRDFMDKWKWYYEGGKHGTASADLMGTLARGRALILVDHVNSYRHIGYASAVLGDTRAGRNRRYEQ